MVNLKLGLHYRLLTSRGSTTSGRSVNDEKVDEFATGRHPPRRRLGEVGRCCGRGAMTWHDLRIFSIYFKLMAQTGPMV